MNVFKVKFVILNYYVYPMRRASHSRNERKARLKSNRRLIFYDSNKFLLW